MNSKCKGKCGSGCEHLGDSKLITEFHVNDMKLSLIIY